MLKYKSCVYIIPWSVPCNDLWAPEAFYLIVASYCTSRNDERPEELRELYKACIISGVAGFMFGGYAQARRSRVHFIDTHNTYVFPSHMQAQVTYYVNTHL